MENSNSFRNLASRWGSNAIDWATSNPGKTAGLVGLTQYMLSGDKGNLINPLITAGGTYALLSLLPNAKRLVGNANYATLEARALMAKGNHLADKVPGAPLIFGRKKAMQRITEDANWKADEVYLKAYMDYVKQGIIKPGRRLPTNMNRVKAELRQVMG